MKIFFDTEFHEFKNKNIDTIELISIGMVDEKGNQLYLISNEFNTVKAWQNDWLRENVCKNLHSSITDLKTFKAYIKKEGISRKEMQKLILDFCGDSPEFWAYYASYDWVVFAWIFGRMSDLPSHFPMYPMDLQQVIKTFGIDDNKLRLSLLQENVHNALDDAKWNYNAWKWIDNYCKI
jgi:cobalamin biosynthesis Co2+ chelatase CbiK